MGFREILEFVRVEHTLFSLPFVLIGFVIADNQFGTEYLDLVWIIAAAIGARGLAMALNRIVDRDIDAENPRTASRHLPSGAMSMSSAWILAASFLGVLLFSAWKLNEVALKMAWLPVLAFVVYPFTKRISWICHFWIGFCLALAPAGAWVAIAADTHGWGSITGQLEGGGEFLWFPEVFFVSLGVALWITAFDINYALMDMDVDREQGIKSFPSTYNEEATMWLSVALTMGWVSSFIMAGFEGYHLWAPSVLVMGLLNINVVTRGARAAMEDEESMEIFQRDLFRYSMLTGWVLLGSLYLLVQ